MQAGLTAQVHREYEASFFYRRAYHWFQLQLYPGTVKYLEKEAREELTHAYEIEEYMLLRGA